MLCRVVDEKYVILVHCGLDLHESRYGRDWIVIPDTRESGQQDSTTRGNETGSIFLLNTVIEKVGRNVSRVEFFLFSVDREMLRELTGLFARRSGLMAM